MTAPCGVTGCPAPPVGGRWCKGHTDQGPAIVALESTGPWLEGGCLAPPRIPTPPGAGMTTAETAAARQGKPTGAGHAGQAAANAGGPAPRRPRIGYVPLWLFGGRR